MPPNPAILFGAGYVDSNCSFALMRSHFWYNPANVTLQVMFPSSPAPACFATPKGDTLLRYASASRWALTLQIYWSIFENY